MASSRPLIVPEKRKLLPPRENSLSTHNRTYHVLNPSAIAAEMCMKAPRNPETKDGLASDQEKSDDAPGHLSHIEFDFATPPQPFLDPPAWEAMLKRSQMKGSLGEGSKQGAGDVGTSRSATTPREEKARTEREAEYSSVAIRGRSSMSGRGKRARGVGRYWGGHH